MGSDQGPEHPMTNVDSSPLPPSRAPRPRRDRARSAFVTRCVAWSGLLLAITAGPAAQQPDPETDSSRSAPVLVESLAPPSPRDARALGIGRYTPDVVVRGLDGKRTSWRSGRGGRLTVLALTSVDCPLCRKFAPSLARIEHAYADRGVRFVFVNVSQLDDERAMRKQVEAQDFDGLYLVDTELELAHTLGAATTTEVFVVDAGNTLRYRGAISDQYGVDFALPEPRHAFLEDALDALLAEEEPTIQATSAPGCRIEPEPGSADDEAAPNEVTYARDVSRIVQNNCVECHRQGGVAPFALDSYERVAKRAAMILDVTHAGAMPPWFAAADDGPGENAPSPWANDRSLSADEIATLEAWVENGKPRGDDADLPLPRPAPHGEWAIGEPDAVFALPEAIAIPADGVLPYRHVAVPTDLASDRWVQAMQILPGDRSVVHHVLVFALPEGSLRNGRVRPGAAFDEARGFFAAYVPGNDSVVYPDGLAKKLPANSVLLFQLHYTPNGTATTDRTRIGFLFSDAPPRHVVETAGIANHRISIPAGASRHPETAKVTSPGHAKLFAFLPHLHVRGTAFRYEIQRPGEQRTTVLDVPHYDFNWQLRYLLREPLDIPAGTTIHATAWYDNSAGNPANPDPDRTVRWGPQTFDEMMLGYIEYYSVDTEQGAVAADDRPSLSFDLLLRRFDRDADGAIQRSEVPRRLARRFDELDRDGDGEVTRGEYDG
jgi:thiol-disulfide isomerase/thioredoxin